MKTRVILLSVPFVIFSTFTTGATRTEPSRQKTTTASRRKPADLSTITVNGTSAVDPAKAFGSKDAVLVIEIFSDFQCPMCKQLFQTTLARVMDTYVTGITPCKIYVIHRDFPLSYHGYSRIAASYSRAAAHIGKCEEVEAALYIRTRRSGKPMAT